MPEDKKNIDKLFSDYLSGYKEKAPLDVWSKLDNELSGKPFPRKNYVFWVAASAAIILIAFFSGYYFASMNTNNAEFISKKETEEIIKPILDENIKKEVAQAKVTESKELEVSKEIINNSEKEISLKTTSLIVENKSHSIERKIIEPNILFIKKAKPIINYLSYSTNKIAFIKNNIIKN